jgi:hypothetical protein
MCFLWGTNWGFISQKTAFFIVTAVKTSNLTSPQHLVAAIVCRSSSLWGTAFCSTARKRCLKAVWNHETPNHIVLIYLKWLRTTWLRCSGASDKRDVQCSVQLLADQKQLRSTKHPVSPTQVHKQLRTVTHNALLCSISSLRRTEFRSEVGERKLLLMSFHRSVLKWNLFLFVLWHGLISSPSNYIAAVVRDNTREVGLSNVREFCILNPHRRQGTYTVTSQRLRGGGEGPFGKHVLPK